MLFAAISRGQGRLKQALNKRLTIFCKYWTNKVPDSGIPESGEVYPMTKTVLIVEDNELNMKLFHDVLDAHGIGTLHSDGYPAARGFGSGSHEMDQGG